MSDTITENQGQSFEEADDLLGYILKDEEVPTKEEKEEEEYEYESYSDESDDIVVVMNQNDTLDMPEDNKPKIDESQDGNITIPNEDKYSAFDLDINMLKIRKWKMIGEESDYFNYGMSETMWKEYREYITKRTGEVDINRLRKYSDSLMAQATHMPYSSSVAHNNNYRHSSSTLPDINSLKPFLNNLSEEQRQFLRDNPDKLQQFVKENLQFNDGDSKSRYSRSRSRHSSYERPSESRSRRHSSFDRPSESRSRRHTDDRHSESRSRRHTDDRHSESRSRRHTDDRHSESRSRRHTDDRHSESRSHHRHSESRSRHRHSESRSRHRHRHHDDEEDERSSHSKRSRHY